MFIENIKENQKGNTYGKGKTSAAVSQAVRAAGHGRNVGWISFLKCRERFNAGEYSVLEDLDIEIKHYVEKYPDFYEDSIPKLAGKECDQAIEQVSKIFQESEYDLLVLDEINICLRDGFLKVEKFLKMLEKLPENMILILTGRGSEGNHRAGGHSYGVDERKYEVRRELRERIEI